MNTPVLLDTSAWITSFKKDSPSSLKNEVEKLLIEKKVVTTQLVILELLSGTKTQKDFDELLEDLNALECIEISSEIWQNAYKLTFSLRRRGLTTPLIDILIASICLKYNYFLIHADNHFDLIKKYYPLHSRNVLK